MFHVSSSTSCRGSAVALDASLRSRLALVALFSFGSATCMMERNALTSQRLKLDELCAVALPEGFSPAGLSVGRSGVVALWAFDSRDLVIVTAGVVTTRQLPASARPVGVRLGEGITDSVMMSVMDGYRNAIIVLSKAARFDIRRTADSSLWLAGAPLGKEWLLAGRAGDEIVFRRLGDEGVSSVRMVSDGPTMAIGAGIQPVWVTSLDSIVIVNERSRPHRIGVLSTTGRTLLLRFVELPKEVAMATSSPGDDADKWTAGPVVALKAGYVVTFSDQSSDTRIIARYDEEWHLHDATRLSVPLAIVAFDLKSDRVLAVRDVGQLELVFYRVSHSGDESRARETDATLHCP
jgi:hypothetical protein